MADMTCIALSAKNLHTLEIDYDQIWCSNLDQCGFQLSVDTTEEIRKIALGERRDWQERSWLIDHVFTKGRSNDQADTLEATPRNLDAAPRNLLIGKDIADVCLDADIFRDDRGYHLHVVGEFLELLPLLNA